METIIKLNSEDINLKYIVDGEYNIDTNHKFSIVFTEDAIIKFSEQITSYNKEIILKDPTPQQELYQREFVNSFVDKLESLKEGRADNFQQAIDLCIWEANSL